MRCSYAINNLVLCNLPCTTQTYPYCHGHNYYVFYNRNRNYLAESIRPTRENEQDNTLSQSHYTDANLPESSLNDVYSNTASPTNFMIIPDAIQHNHIHPFIQSTHQMETNEDYMLSASQNTIIDSNPPQMTNQNGNTNITQQNFLRQTSDDNLTDATLESLDSPDQNIIDLSRTVYNFHFQDHYHQSPPFQESPTLNYARQTITSTITQRRTDFYNQMQHDEQESAPSSPFISQLYTKDNCHICSTHGIGVLLRCCDNKQFICAKCYIFILVNDLKKKNCYNGNVFGRQPEMVLQQYSINCPYCRSKTTLGHCEIIREHLKCIAEIFCNEKSNPLTHTFE